MIRLILIALLLTACEPDKAEPKPPPPICYLLGDNGEYLLDMHGGRIEIPCEVTQAR